MVINDRLMFYISFILRVLHVKEMHKYPLLDHNCKGLVKRLSTSLMSNFRLMFMW